MLVMPSKTLHILDVTDVKNKKGVYTFFSLIRSEHDRKILTKKHILKY